MLHQNLRTRAADNSSLAVICLIKQEQTSLKVGTATLASKGNASWCGATADPMSAENGTES